MRDGNPLFSSRLDAAAKLAALLQDYQGRHPLILAIPRGAVPMGREIAQRLGGELDVVLVRKLGMPFDPEFALGAISEDGWVHLTTAPRAYGVSDAAVEAEKTRQLALLKARRERYTPSRKPVDPAGRIVIIVDDGLATGATMIAALHAVRARGPAELVCAVPVAAADSLAQTEPYADRVVCPYPRDDFMSVSRFYRDFAAVEDDEVIRILGAAQGDAAPT